jgi:hypothetical protein
MTPLTESIEQVGCCKKIAMVFFMPGNTTAVIEE